MTLDELKDRLDALSPTGIRFVARMVESLYAPPQARVNEQGTWLTADWIEYFGLALSVHHGTTTEPLAQKGFETVFRNACESVGWAVGKPVSETQRFLDLEIKRDGSAKQKLSLKSRAKYSDHCRRLLWNHSMLTDRPLTVPMVGTTSRLAYP